MITYALAIYGVPFMGPRDKDGGTLRDYRHVPDNMIRDRLETFDTETPWTDGTYIPKRAGGNDSNCPVEGARLRVPDGDLKHSMLGGMRLSCHDTNRYPGLLKAPPPPLVIVLGGTDYEANPS